MTFLELCQAVRREAGIAGTGPVAVTSQTGMYDKIVRWVNRAWTEIQALHPHWNFLLSTEQTFSLQSGTMEYTPAGMGMSDWGAWSFDDLKVHDSTEGLGSQRFLIEKPWPWFRDRYTIGAQSDGFPIYVSESPTNKLVVGPAPDSDDYVLSFRYFKAPAVLVDAADVPALPTRFHDIIVQKALMIYAVHDNAQEVYADATLQYNQLLGMLEFSELPKPEYAFGALA